MMTGAPINLNHIEPDRVILAANGDFVDPEGADEDGGGQQLFTLHKYVF